MAVRFSTIHRRAFYAMRTYYYLLTTNGFYRDSGAFAPYPSNSRMGRTLSTTHPGIAHDIAQLHHSDDKTVQGFISVQIGENLLRSNKYTSAQRIPLKG